jgi:IclR family transcriptional regulator, pca regulon regulatory protein
MERKRKYFIESLARGIKILQAFSYEETHLSLSELAERVQLRIPVVQRYTDTLQQLGLLKKNKYKEFFLGPRVLSLGFSFLQGSQLKKMAEATLSELSEKIKQNVNMGVLDGDQVIYLFRNESRTFIKLDLQTGSKMPAYCTSMGKVLLASLEDQELTELVEHIDFKKLTSHTLVDPENLFRDLMKTRERGYGICNRELSLDLYALAVPVVNYDGKVIAAVNVSVSIDQVEKKEVNSVLDELLIVGKDISSSLGYVGNYPLINNNKSYK